VTNDEAVAVARGRLEQSMAELRRAQRSAAKPRVVGTEDLLHALPSIPPNMKVRSNSYFQSRLRHLP
jgi:hypothetical protein